MAGSLTSVPGLTFTFYWAPKQDNFTEKTPQHTPRKRFCITPPTSSLVSNFQTQAQTAGKLLFVDLLNTRHCTPKPMPLGSVESNGSKQVLCGHEGTCPSDTPTAFPLDLTASTPLARVEDMKIGQEHLVMHASPGWLTRQPIGFKFRENRSALKNCWPLSHSMCVREKAWGIAFRQTCSALAAGPAWGREPSKVCWYSTACCPCPITTAATILNNFVQLEMSLKFLVLVGVVRMQHAQVFFGPEIVASSPACT